MGAAWKVGAWNGSRSKKRLIADPTEILRRHSGAQGGIGRIPLLDNVEKPTSQS